jgi:hypothetical protein
MAETLPMLTESDRRRAWNHVRARMELAFGALTSEGVPEASRTECARRWLGDALRGIEEGPFFAEPKEED